MEAKKFNFTFKFLDKDYEAQYTIKLIETKDKREEQRFYVDFEDDDSQFFWENEYLFSYDTTKKAISFPPISPIDFELISSIADAIITLEYFNTENE